MDLDTEEPKPSPPKRSREGNPKNRNRKDQSEKPKPKPCNLPSNHPSLLLFKKLAESLDKKHDKYERLVKLSRDVTIESKRIIFLLHRLNGSEQDAEVYEEAESRFQNLQSGTIKEMAKEFIGEDFYQYHRPVSFGQQEYVEALTYYHFLRDHKIPTFQKVQESITFQEDSEIENTSEGGSKITLPLTETDYLLGIADLTGELMRKCIQCVSRGRKQDCFEICDVMRSLLDGFVSLGNQGSRDIVKKLYTMKQSVAKVENACYTIKVRGTEIPDEMLVDFFSASVGED